MTAAEETRVAKNLNATAVNMANHGSSTTEPLVDSVDSVDCGAWNNLGLAGGGRVGSRRYTKRECFEQALERDARCWAAWNNLSFEGGGQVGGVPYSKRECIQRALEVNDTQSCLWHHLALAGGGQVHGARYTGTECSRRAEALEPPE